MIPIVNPEAAKAIEATAKAAATALEIVHDTGGYLNRVFGNLPQNAVGLLGGDWLEQQRIRNLDVLRRRTVEILRSRGVKDRIELSPNLATELLSAAQDESQIPLAELWARLLANAMDPSMNNVRHSFIEAVKKMDPMDAIILQNIFETNFPVVRRGGGTQNDNSTNVEKLSKAISCRMDEVEVSLRHLETLLFFDTIANNNNWYVNATNREFMRACYPEGER